MGALILVNRRSGLIEHKDAGAGATQGRDQVGAPVAGPEEAAVKHAVIIAHPNPDSLTAASGAAYLQAAGELGHEVIVRDLYRMGFDPCLKASETPTAKGLVFGADVLAEREQLEDVDVFAFHYPLWFNAPPAILKGYVDRVFSMGFGYTPVFGGAEPALTGRKLISFTLSGAPDHWISETGVIPALMSLFDNHLAAVCGLEVVDHVHAGGITPGITREAGEDVLAAVRQAVTRRFAGVSI